MTDPLDVAIRAIERDVVLLRRMVTVNLWLTATIAITVLVLWLR